jgi:hypothetical protein
MSKYEEQAKSISTKQKLEVNALKKHKLNTNPPE